MVFLGQFLLVGLQHVDLLLHFLLLLLEVVVLLDQLDGFVRHLGQLCVDGDVLSDGPLGGLGHLLVGDFAELSGHLVDPEYHLLLQPVTEGNSGVSHVRLGTLGPD